MIHSRGQLTFPRDDDLQENRFFHSPFGNELPILRITVLDFGRLRFIFSTGKPPVHVLPALPLISYRSQHSRGTFCLGVAVGLTNIG